MRCLRHIASAASLALLASCADAMAPTGSQIEQFRASWASHQLTRYAYDLEITGFNISWAGQLVHLVVLNDTVRSATYVATGDSVPVPPATFSTIDGLFAQAIAARSAGTLAGIQFDSTFSYPREIDLTGPPDASGSVTASNLALLP